MQTRVSLSPESEAGGEARYWATFSDVALVLVLVMVLVILAQFLKYERIFVLERIAARQDSVRVAIGALEQDFDGVDFEVIKEDEFNQRVRVSGELVFLECRDDLTASGRSLVEDLGRVFARVGTSNSELPGSWFTAIQVEGHADRQAPSSPVCRAEGIEDNWQLSARRATEVVRVFSAGGFIPNEKLSSVGRGQYQPLSAPSDTARAILRRDRRIEVVLRYSDEGIMGGGDD